VGNKHNSYVLAQMQSLPLSAKERMSEQRIKVWFESWYRYKLVNKVTGRVVYKASVEEPKLTKNQYVDEVESGACYVGFSGGKDSTVLADLTARFCKEYGYKLVLLFVNTGLEYPEIQKHVKEFHKYLETKYDMEIELVIKRPEMRFDQVLKEYGYPIIGKEVAQKIDEARKGYKSSIEKLNGTYKKDKVKNYNTDYNNISKYKYLLDSDFRISDRCCKVMKKKPSVDFSKETARVQIVGTMANESSLRRSNWLRFGCNAFDSKKPSSQPLSFWTEQDILEYIVKYELPIASVYGEILQDPKTGKYYSTGVKRTGCIFCAFGAQCRGDRRFLDLKESHPRQYNYCINGGTYKWYGYVKSSVDWKSIDFINEDGTPFTENEIECYIEKHKNDDSYKFERIWVPSKEGLGLGKVLDYVGVKYKEDEEAKHE